MLVNSVCCGTCRKRVSNLQLPFLRMTTATMTYEDVCRFILSQEPQLLSKEELTNPILLALNIYSSWEERMNALEALLTEELSEELEIYISNIQTLKFEAPLAHKVLGVIRPCCKRALNDPPVAPIFSGSKPAGSKRVLDEGQLKRLVVRNGSSYTITNYFNNNI